jgi:ATP-dependent Lon protease
MTYAIQGEIDVLGTERKIQSRVRKQMESNQRDYYLNEQMKSIQKELGQAEDERWNWKFDFCSKLTIASQLCLTITA